MTVFHLRSSEIDVWILLTLFCRFILPCIYPNESVNRKHFAVNFSEIDANILNIS